MKIWEPPCIQPHRLGPLNKFGRRTAREETAEQFDGRNVEGLMERYGSPLFLTSERRLRRNVRRLVDTFTRRCGPTVHGWSYKTNYTSALCNILHQEGSWAEVVSGFEYAKARKLGVPADRILFNGPAKSREALERAAREGARIHLDHFDELNLLEEVAREQGRTVKVTLRLQVSTAFTEPWSRFGFSLDSGAAHEAARRIRTSPHLDLAGLHSHIGTFILEPRAYGEQVRKMCDFMREVEKDGAFIEYLDIGGGFPSRNHLQGIYLPPSQAVPDLDEYADAVGEALDESLPEGRRPLLILESGRAVVDDTQVLATTVVGTRRLPDGRRGAVLDAGLNLLFTAQWYHHAVKPTRELEGLPGETVLYGPLCMNIDVMRHSVQLPPLNRGDRLVFSHVGAYNNTQWMQFIECRPAIVLIHEDGRESVIREREDLETMCSLDRLPEHLQAPQALAVR